MGRTMSGMIGSLIPSRGASGRAVAVLAVLSAAMLAGCAKRDSITVGSVPDDYRTNHPIVLSEREQVLDLPVGAGAMRLTRGERETLGGFVSGYDRDSRTAVRVMVPTGSANAAAASYVSSDIVAYLRSLGVDGGAILVDYYDAGAPDAAAPVRVTYSALRANVDKCGRWPADLLSNADNKHWANFGCSYQNNLAAQMANPTDLLGPRKPTSIDPENRANAIEQYKARSVAGDMRANREVEY